MFGSTTYQYDALGKRTHVIDALGNDSQTQYCPLGIRVTGQIDPDPDGPGGPLGRPATIYGYDAGLRQVSVTDPLGRTTLTDYDALGRATAVYAGQTLDNGEAGYAEPTGIWSTVSGGYGAGSRAATATGTPYGSPTATAAWSFAHLLAGEDYGVGTGTQLVLARWGTAN